MNGYMVGNKSMKGNVAKMSWDLSSPIVVLLRIMRLITRFAIPLYSVETDSSYPHSMLYYAKRTYVCVSISARCLGNTSCLTRLNKAVSVSHPESL